jgi:hypothetical protein
MAKVQKITPAEAKRLQLGLSYEQVAQGASRPVSTVRYYLKTPKIKTLNIADDIAKALDDDITLFIDKNLVE